MSLCNHSQDNASVEADENNSLERGSISPRNLNTKLKKASQIMKTSKKYKPSNYISITHSFKNGVAKAIKASGTTNRCKMLKETP